jgi:hypothetical protein
MIWRRGSKRSLPACARGRRLELATMPSRWLTIFKTQTDGSAKAVGDRILRDLFGYSYTRAGRVNRYADRDAEEIANALVAFSRIGEG